MRRERGWLRRAPSLGLIVAAAISPSGGCGDVVLHGQRVRAPDGTPCEGDTDCASGACTSSVCAPSWPRGALGDVVVAKGTRLTLASGGVYDFASLTVESGATLDLAEGATWTFIGCRGTLRVDGELAASRGTSCGGRLTARAPDGSGRPGGEALAFEVPAPVGGDGGQSGSGLSVDALNHRTTPIDNEVGGRARCGNGGGGGGGGNAFFVNLADPGGDASTMRGGDGGKSGEIPGGPGATATSSDGSAGRDADWSQAQSGLGGGGGGGGTRGLNGQALYLKVGALTGTGVIHADGDRGGAGGRGGNGSWWSSPEHASSGAGGGGGGGAGGSGGALVIRYRDAIDPNFLATHIRVRGAPGGASGANGAAASALGDGATAGNRGADGTDGVVDAKGW